MNFLEIIYLFFIIIYIMRKFKYYNNSVYENDGLTHCKIYDMVEYLPDKFNNWYDRIVIINDHGEKTDYLINYDYSKTILFKEVTVEYRNMIINDILQ